MKFLRNFEDVLVITFCYFQIQLTVVHCNSVSYDPCIAALCMENTKCISVPNPENCLTPSNCELMAKCVPIDPQQPGLDCGGQMCQPGEKCELVQVNCITTPCPPLPTCVPILPPYQDCGGRTCPSGETCEVVQVQCFAPPCPPLPTCVPVKPGQQCGNQVCPPEETCEVIQVQCFAPPCPPMPTCVPKPPSKFFLAKGSFNWGFGLNAGIRPHY